MIKSTVLLLCFAVLFSLANAHGTHRAARFLSSFSFKPPYFPDAGLASVPGWRTEGSAVVHDSAIRLTPNLPDQSGMLLNKRPYFLKTVELTLDFKVHSDKPYGADGIALWLSDRPIQPGPVFGGPEKWKGIAVILDTYDNDGLGEHPMIALHFNNGEKNFDFTTDGASTLLTSCTFNYRNPATSSLLHLYIEDDTVHLFVDVENNGNWERCGPGTEVEMPKRYFFSLSAATGGLSDTHDILSLQVNTMDSRLAGPQEMQKPDDNFRFDHDGDGVSDRNADPEEDGGPLVEGFKEELSTAEKEAQISQNSLREAQNRIRALELDAETQQQEWKTKERELQEALRLAREVERPIGAAAGATDAPAKCETLFAECSNREDTREALRKSSESLREQLRHELSETGFLLADRSQRLEDKLSPFPHHIGSIKDDMLQTNSLVSQMTQAMANVQVAINNQAATRGSAKLTDLLSSLTLCQKSIIKALAEQRKLMDQGEVLREAIKNSRSGSLLEVLIPVFLGLTVFLHAYRLLTARKQKRRSMLY